jgi:hypothetical protein
MWVDPISQRLTDLPPAPSQGFPSLPPNIILPPLQSQALQRGPEPKPAGLAADRMSPGGEQPGEGGLAPSWKNIPVEGGGLLVPGTSAGGPEGELPGQGGYDRGGAKPRQRALRKA